MTIAQFLSGQLCEKNQNRIKLENWLSKVVNLNEMIKNSEQKNRIKDHIESLLNEANKNDQRYVISVRKLQTSSKRTIIIIDYKIRC